MNTSKSRTPIVAAALALSVLGLAGPATHAMDVARFVTRTPDQKGYTINYETLEKAQDLDATQKRQIASALRQGPGHYADQLVEDIAGLSGSCTVKKDWGIPVHVDCTLSADPSATKVLSQLGTLALTTALCLVIDAADLEVTALICDAVLEPVAEITLGPVLDQCANQGESTSISIGIDIVPPRPDGLSASCQ